MKDDSPAASPVQDAPQQADLLAKLLAFSKEQIDGMHADLSQEFYRGWSAAFQNVRNWVNEQLKAASSSQEAGKP